MLNRDRLPRLSPLLLAVLLLSPGWAAKPVLQVWREMKGASIRVVTPDSPASAGWVQTLLGPLPTNVVGPSDYLGNSRLNGGEQVVVLYRRDQAASWPEPLLGRLARNPASLPVDEVLVATKQVGKGNWETTVIAPDEAQLREAFTQLLQTDSAAFSSQPSAMLSWKVVEGLGIGTGETHLRAWLSAQNSPRQRLKARVCSPANPDPEALRNSPVSLVALTYTEWRDLGKPLQDILHGLLPAAAADALRNGEDRRLMTAAETKDGKLRLAVVAPSARFVEALLPLAAETDELRAMKYGSAVAGAQLTSLSSAGGACELKDLRGYRTAVITAAGLTNELGGPAAADFAYKLRRALAEQGGWQFIDDQALEASVRRQVQEGAFGAGGQVRTAGADALIIARLHHVEQRTDYAEGQAQQLTPRPVAFTEIEPAKPDPDARLYIIAGPKVYPNGINDPKYATDLATWDTNYRQWQQRRDAHAYQTQNAEVVWEQKLLVRQTVRIDGILEIYSRDGVLVTSLPIVGGNQLITTKPTRTTVRGYTSAPTALSLPSAENRVPDTMVTDAIGEAATRTAQSLTLTALTPRDGGARPTADIGTQPVQPVAETGGRATTPTTGQATGGQATSLGMVEVTGIAPLGADRDTARKVARAEACRMAVEQVVGTYVDSMTEVDTYKLIQDRILTRATGFAMVKEVVGEQVKEGELHLTCRVEVTTKPLREQLVGMGLARQWRVMIVVPEQHLRRVVPDPAAENSLMRNFIQAGLPVIDKSHSEELRNNKDMLLQIQGNPDLARKLRLKYNAEILVTGEAFSQDVDPVHGQAACRARLEIKAIDLNTAEILAAEDQHSTGVDQTSELAGKVALRRAADDVSERFIDMIYRRPMPTAGGARIEVTLTGFKGFTQAANFKKALTKVSGVTNVRQLEFSHGELKLEVELSQAAVENLPAELESNPAMAEFKIGIQSVTTGTITGALQP